MITLGRHSYQRHSIERFNPDVEVGNFTSIAENVTFYGSCEHPWVMNNKSISNFPFADLEWGDYTPCGSRGKITIGSDVWIGEHVIILDGVTIGDGAIVGAGSVVGNDIEPFSVSVGNPCKKVKYRFPDDVKIKLMRLKWWEWSDEKIRSHLPSMKDYTKFLEGLE